MERSDIEDSFERSEKQMIRLYNLISLFQTNLSLPRYNRNYLTKLNFKLIQII